MGNKLTDVKKFLGNKNTVTIFCVILGIIVLYLGYNFRVNNATDPVRVPYAKNTIPKKTKLTAELIGYTNIPRSLVNTSKTILTNEKNVIGKYASYASPIPANSYFYSDAVMKEEQMPDYAFMNMADGYTVYSLKVNMNTTYANKILPNTYIDLYAALNVRENGSDTNKVLYARLIKSIKVKAVKDDKGRSLLETGVSNGTPSAMLFEVPNDLFLLLKKAEYVGDIEIRPVPRNATYTSNAGETEVDNTTIENIINSKCEEVDSRFD